MVLSMAPELLNDVRIRVLIPRLIVILLLAIAAAQAATLTVTSAADRCGSCPGAGRTLRQAISDTDQHAVEPAPRSFLPLTNNVTTPK
jgi:hypothetical protein